MTSDTVLRDVSVLLDRYLEVSNHYARELRSHLQDFENSPSRLSALIARLEAIESSATDPTRAAERSAPEEETKGQNIVRTADTLAALRISANEILGRLDAPMQSVPHNIWWLRNWLKRPAAEIAAGFPSFTYAWDKMIDLNRLTLAPDSRFLRVRDNVSLARMEFERFVLELRRLVSLAQKNGPAGEAPDGERLEISPQDALDGLCIQQVASLDPLFNERVRRVKDVLRKREDFLDQSSVLREAVRDTDALALSGLELGFTSWLGLANPSREHRKTIIMSMLVCSKQFLVEASWQNAKEFSRFAIKLTTRTNADLGLDTNEGTAMLRFNEFWARHKLGENILDEVEQWDVSGLHARYSFMKSVLLRKFDDAIRILETLLPTRNPGEAGNFSMPEAEEWPILQDFRSSSQYEALKQRLKDRATA